MSAMTPTRSAQVLCVALNPALDHTIVVDRLRPGEVNRALGLRAEVGGKGFNVASCLADFGVPTAVTGLVGSANAGPVEALFRAKGIEDHCLRLEGQTRVNIKLVDPSAGQTTDINLPGPDLPAGDRTALLDQLLAQLDLLVGRIPWVVLAGSLPPGWPEDTYRVLARHVRRAGGKVALDASGPALAAGLQAVPDLVKPNRAELAEWCGEPLDTLPAVAAAGRRLLAGAAWGGLVVVSLGADGALFLDRERAWHAHAPTVDLTSTVGAGDAMVAGAVAAQLAGLPLDQCARLATAFSAAKLARIGAHLPGPDVVRALAETVLLSDLS